MIKTLNSMLDRLDSAFKAENPLSVTLHMSWTIRLLPFRENVKSVCWKKEARENTLNPSNEFLRKANGYPAWSGIFFFFHDKKKNSWKQYWRDYSGWYIKRVDSFRWKNPSSFGRDRPADDCKSQSVSVEDSIKNIIDNACKYSDKEVNVTLYREQQQVILDIEDRGIGIPQEEIEHIFQSFYRGSNTRDYAGQGIGLSLTLKSFLLIMQSWIYLQK